MAKLKAVTKKVAKKAAKKAMITAKVVASRKLPPAAVAIKAATRSKAEGKRMDEMEDLKNENESLQEENKSLREQLKQLGAQAAKNAATIGTGALKRWIRGKLPGERLIKTDPETGKYEEIDKAEWDSLA